MNRKKIEVFKKKLLLRTEEAVINIQSRNYPKICELPMIAGTYMSAAAIFKNVSTQKSFRIEG